MSVTVFEDHSDNDPRNIASGHLSTHVVTCRNARCAKKGVPVTTPPLPGHVEAEKRGRPKLREQVFCGECGQAIVWAEVRRKG